MLTTFWVLVLAGIYCQDHDHPTLSAVFYFLCLVYLAQAIFGF